MKIRALYDLFGGKCAYCSRRTVIGAYAVCGDLSATKDHDIPKCRIKHFQDLHTNELLACHGCNNAKSDMTGPEFLSFRQTRKFPQTYIEFLEQRTLKRVKLT